MSKLVHQIRVASDDGAEFDKRLLLVRCEHVCCCGVAFEQVHLGELDLGARLDLGDGLGGRVTRYHHHNVAERERVTGLGLLTVVVRNGAPALAGAGAASDASGIISPRTAAISPGNLYIVRSTHFQVATIEYIAEDAAAALQLCKFEPEHCAGPGK